MGNVTLEHKFSIGDKVVVSSGHIMFADADPMGNPWTDFKGCIGKVERMTLSYLKGHDERKGKEFNSTDVHYDVNISGNSFSFREESLSLYKN